MASEAFFLGNALERQEENRRQWAAIGDLEEATATVVDQVARIGVAGLIKAGFEDLAKALKELEDLGHEQRNAKY